MAVTRIVSINSGLVVPETDTKPVLFDEEYQHKLDRLGFAVKAVNDALREIGVTHRVHVWAWTPCEEGFDDNRMEAVIRLFVTTRGGLE